MKRREFLQLGAVCTATTVISPATAWGETGGTTHLTIEPCDFEMIDGYMCYMCFFFDGDEPHPVLRTSHGANVQLEITNNDAVPHGFAITGVPLVGASDIRPGETRTISFKAPPSGSYIYYDPTNDPVNRLIGLQGALVIDPQLGTTPAGSPTPYSRAMQTPAVRDLFDAFGNSRRFPGDKWRPGHPDREKIWLFSQTDPELNRRVAYREPVDGASVKNWFLPRYFHINYISGIDTAEHEGQDSDASKAAQGIMPSGRQGEPTLIRSMNAGLCSHSPHIHGNHVMVLSGHNRAGRVVLEGNVLERDVWQLRPMERRDVLLPFERPPDIPLARWPMEEEPWPLRYVMHCHCEMSQTAAGGNYPQGLVTHWEMTGPVSG